MQNFIFVKPKYEEYRQETHLISNNSNSFSRNTELLIRKKEVEPKISRALLFRKQTNKNNHQTIPHSPKTTTTQTTHTFIRHRNILTLPQTTKKRTKCVPRRNRRQSKKEQKLLFELSWERPNDLNFHSPSLHDPFWKTGTLSRSHLIWQQRCRDVIVEQREWTLWNGVFIYWGFFMHPPGRVGEQWKYQAK